MKKLSYSIAFFFLSILIVQAAPRSREQALQIANQFLIKTTPKTDKAKMLPAYRVSNLLYQMPSKANKSENVLYVFERGGGLGYVIVSGDDRAHKILAYSDSSIFEADNMPDNLREWLRFYENEILSLDGVNSQQGDLESTFSQNSYNETVAPLLGGIKWNQSDPYNLLCPVITTSGKRTVTGCVATGMAMVMKYHQWPVTGKGANSYTSTTHGFQLSSNFEAVNFDWNNMTDTYGASSTQAQKDAVATLMYNCGVAVNMNYDLSSGASTTKMAHALKDYFRYDENLEYLLRNYYSRQEWTAFLLAELNAQRPVLYNGNSNASGHLFVCDGYDSNGFFHFNWGWGGMSDGYFQISALNPSSQGIGGSTGGYNSAQGIVVGLQKPNPNSSKSKMQLHMNETITFTPDSLLRTDNLDFTIKNFFNYGIRTLTGTIGVAVFDNDDKMISMLSSRSISGLQTNYGYSSMPFSRKGLPSSLLPGNYRVFVVFKEADDTQWQKLRGLVGTPSFLNLSVTDTKLCFSLPTEEKPKLELQELAIQGKLYKTKRGRFTVKITNNGKEYNSVIGLQIQPENDVTTIKILSSEVVNIASGETRELNFISQMEFTPGNYKLSVLYDPANSTKTNAELSQLGAQQNVEILSAPTGTYALNLKSKISFPDNNYVNREGDVLAAVIENTGSLFDNKMLAFVFPKNGGTSLTYIGIQDVWIDNNETVSLRFQGAMNLEPKEYQIGLYYANANNGWTKVTPNENATLIFKLASSYTAVVSVEAKTNFTVSPLPAHNLLTITSENAVKTAKIFSLTGQLLINRKFDGAPDTIDISALKPGNYLIQVGFENYIETAVFIKK